MFYLNMFDAGSSCGNDGKPVPSFLLSIKERPWWNCNTWPYLHIFSDDIIEIQDEENTFFFGFGHNNHFYHWNFLCLYELPRLFHSNCQEIWDEFYFCWVPICSFSGQFFHILAFWFLTFKLQISYNNC